MKQILYLGIIVQLYTNKINVTFQKHFLIFIAKISYPFYYNLLNEYSDSFSFINFKSLQSKLRY